ncbi:MAG: agmatine deiminase family protein [Kiritimatiellae bacterium]|nr:agmatine deiminase family protein [Kiritimatiellia bacterium]
MVTRSRMVRSLAVASVLAGCAVAWAQAPSNVAAPARSLIVLAAPPTADRYYEPLRQAILEFQTAYARRILGRDNVVILGDRATLRELAQTLPADILLEAPMRDIWTRDFFPVLPDKPILFRYAAAAQSGSQARADRTQADVVQLAHRLTLDIQQVPWILDGGNVVANGDGRAIVSDRFLTDNHLDRTQALALLHEHLGADQIAILPADPDDRLGHADGIAAFLGTNTVAITQGHDNYHDAVVHQLRSAFPGIQIIELAWDEVNDAFDPEYGSATGLHLNATLTDRFLYVPVYGRESDARALEQIRAATDRVVVPVDAAQVGRLGGSVRCLGAQMKGDNARRLIKAARAN